MAADFIVAPLFVSLTALLPKAQVCCDIMCKSRSDAVIAIVSLVLIY